MGSRVEAIFSSYPKFSVVFNRPCRHDTANNENNNKCANYDHRNADSSSLCHHFVAKVLCLCRVVETMLSTCFYCKHNLCGATRPSVKSIKVEHNVLYRGKIL